jgi:hypothetical protein
MTLAVAYPKIRAPWLNVGRPNPWCPDLGVVHQETMRHGQENSRGAPSINALRLSVSIVSDLEAHLAVAYGY